MNNDRAKVVVLLSGGLDSTTLLYHHLKHGDEVRCISFNYGQRHGRELEAATRIAHLLNLPHQIVNLTELRRLLSGSSQTDSSIPVPEGKYDEETMKITVVPNRNMILLALSIGYAVANKMDYVSYAAHSGDHAIYPDCREEFAAGMDRVARLCDWHPVSLLRPFVKLTKANIVSYGKGLGVPYELTWSCYKGGEAHCGRCGTCIERREAFYLAQVEDPTVYHPSAPSIQDLIKNDWYLPP